jgi:hypothetical protein
MSVVQHMNQELMNNEVTMEKFWIPKIENFQYVECQILSLKFDFSGKENSNISDFSGNEKNTKQKVEQILPYNALIQRYLLSPMVSFFGSR